MLQLPIQQTPRGTQKELGINIKQPVNHSKRIYRNAASKYNSPNGTYRDTERERERETSNLSTSPRIKF
jgi:hypothetical protein